MEELARIRTDLLSAGKTVYDFGTGDPRIALWPAIVKSLQGAVPTISQYPSAKGSPALLDAQWNYLQRRFGIARTDAIDLAATRGSKEAVFHAAQSIIGRSGKKTLVFPDPGYPVYYSSAQFAGGRPYPVPLREEDGYLLKPWLLPVDIQEDAAAIWLNYPHNPTGATADRAYWEEVIEWCHKVDCLLLSDDCYVDIYNPSIKDPDQIPLTPLALSADRVIAFFSLSKRSGLTGFRTGFMAGDARFIKAHLRARANMGQGNPDFVQAAAITAWTDDEHVEVRRKIFQERLDIACARLRLLGLVDQTPQATFYLWCRLPSGWTDDRNFCIRLAERGVICSPSSWLGSVSGYFRMAMVPDVDATCAAIDILESFIREEQP